MHGCPGNNKNEAQVIVQALQPGQVLAACVNIYLGLQGGANLAGTAQVFKLFIQVGPDFQQARPFGV